MKKQSPLKQAAVLVSEGFVCGEQRPRWQKFCGSVLSLCQRIKGHQHRLLSFLAVKAGRAAQQIGAVIERSPKGGKAPADVVGDLGKAYCCS